MSQSSLVTLMAPDRLASLIDEETDRVLGHSSAAKHNPYPRLRMSDGRSRRRRRTRTKTQAALSVDKPAPRRYIYPEELYAVGVTVGSEEKAVETILEHAPCATEPRVPVLPSGDLWCPGYVFLAFDHQMTPAEQSAVVERFKDLKIGFLQPVPLPPEDRAMVVLLSMSSMEAV